MKKVLTAKKVNKTVQLGKDSTQEILKDVDLTINEGEFVAVMGPSGCGKSTLLYNISGMDLPTGGEVFIDGTSLTGMNDKELSTLRLAKLGFIFQQYNLLKNLSILDNILLPALQLNKGNRQQIVEQGTALMAKFGISDIRDKAVSQVSGGQLQRAAICRSVINNPKILFGDEPTGSLNSQATENVLDIFQRINEEGTTIVLVTHDVRVAARAQRVLLMKDGMIIEDRDMEEFSPDFLQREEALNQLLLEKNI